MTKQTTLIIVATVVVLVVGLVSWYGYNQIRENRSTNSNLQGDNSIEGLSLPNPASLFCIESMNGKLEIKDTAEGQVGVCLLPDGRECEEWELFKTGECAVSPEVKPVQPREVAKGNTVDLSGRGLTRVPADLLTDTGIEVLNLSNNNLSGALPGEIRHLQALRVLDLSNNKFTGVPAEVGQLKELEILDLSNNPITGLPYEIANLKNLKTLNLRSTNYSKLDLEVIRQGLPATVKIITDN